MTATTKTCTRPDCDDPYRSNGLCHKHNMRRLRNGTTELVGPASGPDNAAWNDDPSYATMHLRVRRARGDAADHYCAVDGCPYDDSRLEWALVLERAAENRALRFDRDVPAHQGVPMAFSTDVGDYQVLCKMHHARYDADNGAVHYDPISETFMDYTPPADNPCSIDTCPDEVKARGWCGRHYERWRRHGDPLHLERTRNDNPPDTCTKQGCDSPHKAKGLCQLHYGRQARADREDAFQARERKLANQSEANRAVDMVNSTRGLADLWPCAIDPDHDGKTRWAVDRSLATSLGALRYATGRDGNPVPYSDDPTHWVAACPDCATSLEAPSSDRLAS